MREILFRGKSKSKERWVYEKVVNDDDLVEELNLYTGINDKNGKRIFEGDIVKAKDHLPGGEFEFTGVVDFKDGSFVIENDEMTHYRWIDYEIEVIGNKFDNPELLEG